MKASIFSLLFMIYGVTAFCQETRVIVSEEKQGRRVILYGENTTKDTLNVFFMVKGKGYRRSASRPTIKDINPGDKIELITLIELAGSSPSYDYTLVVNDREHRTDLSYNKPTIDIEKKITGKLVLFVDENCQKCDYLKTLLTNNRINYQIFDVDKEPETFKQFNAFIQKKYPEVNAVRLPVIWNKNELLLGYDDANEILDYLRK